MAHDAPALERSVILDLASTLCCAPGFVRSGMNPGAPALFSSS
jgi:hypothetical protein